jgi:uncharacterized protein YggE
MYFPGYRYPLKKINMKKIISMLFVVCLFQAVIAQQTQPLFTNNPFPKTISVSGSAEMEIVPDEIYVNILLTEYQKRGEPKKDLETIKTQFAESCKAVGIPDSLISIAFYSGYSSGNYYYIRKKKSPDLFATITYQVKFKNSKLMDDLVEKLDDNATRNFSIVSVSHSKIKEFRRELKIKAIQAAREKGIYLTEAVGEKLGETITINEPAEWRPPVSVYNNRGENTSLYFKSMGIEEEQGNGNGSAIEVDFKKFKLKFEVNVVFALK